MSLQLVEQKRKAEDPNNTMHFPYEILLENTQLKRAKTIRRFEPTNEYGRIHQQVCVPFFPQESDPAKMTTNVAAEEFPESKTATPVKQQIVWRNVVQLTVIHLLALYAAVVVLPRMSVITFIWSRWRLVFLLHAYTSI
jgi:hypothetical protein